MPTVTSISHHEGHAAGKQTLTISGTSLDGKNVSVTVDGISCTVESISETELTCKTGEKTIDPEAIAPSYYVGQQGVNRYNFDRHGYSYNLHASWRNAITDYP
jgi:riboflavin synthase alpha subunit